VECRNSAENQDCNKDENQSGCDQTFGEIFQINHCVIKPSVKSERLIAKLLIAEQLI
jgi:hypothetical protein